MVQHNMEKRSLKYMYHVVDNLPDNQGLQTLQSYYYTKCGLLELQQSDLLVPKGARCPKCNIASSDKLKISRIYPEKKPDRFDRRLAAKIHNGTLLTRYQTLHQRKLKTSSQNLLVSKCAICKNTTKRSLNKPCKSIEHSSANSSDNVKNKKKRKKDKFAGLNKQAVLSVIGNDAQAISCANKKNKNLTKAKTSQFPKEERKQEKQMKKEKSKAKNRLLKINSVLDQTIASKGKVSNSLNKFLKTL